MEYTRLGATGIEGQPARARLHELRRPDHPERPPVGAHRGRGAAVLPAGRRARRDVLGHRERVPARHLRGVRRPRDHPLLPPRGHRARHQGAREDARRPGRGGPVAQGDPRAGRRVADAARHRLHRPVPDPPLRRGHAGRGDDGGAARHHQGRQGALHRRLLDVRVAVRQAPARRRPAAAGRGSCPCRTSTTCCAGTTSPS